MSTGPIVVGIDGSESASRAADWALSWGAATGTPVRIIASEAVPPGHTQASPGLGAKAEAAISAERDRLGTGPDGVEFALQAVVSHPVTALLGASQEAAAVVVGTRGTGAFKGSVVGSIAGAVAAQAHCPTVVIPPGAPERYVAEGPIVVRIDGSEPDIGAVGLAISAARAEGRAVTLIQAGTGDTESEQPVEGMAEEFRRDNPDVEIEVRVLDDVVAGLTEGSRGAGFVVLASQGHRGVPGFLLGPTTRALVQSAEAPVIVLTGRSEKRWPVSGSST